MTMRFVPALALMSAFALSSCAVTSERGFESSVDDTRIKADISTTYLDARFKMYHEIQVDVMEGRVMLTGTVKEAPTREDAVKIAWQTAGVRQVIDEIQVTDEGGFTAGVNDAWIANKLRSQLMFDNDVRTINYIVEVENGVIYLFGIAQNQTELDRVVAFARDISGVTKVINHVVLKDDPRRNSQ